jgi:hypothetical protein
MNRKRQTPEQIMGMLTNIGVAMAWGQKVVQVFEL